MLCSERNMSDVLRLGGWSVDRNSWVISQTDPRQGDPKRVGTRSSETLRAPKTPPCHSSHDPPSPLSLVFLAPLFSPSFPLSFPFSFFTSPTLRAPISPFIFFQPHFLVVGLSTLYASSLLLHSSFHPCSSPSPTPIPAPFVLLQVPTFLPTSFLSYKTYKPISFNTKFYNCTRNCAEFRLI